MSLTPASTSPTTVPAIQMDTPDASDVYKALDQTISHVHRQLHTSLKSSSDRHMSQTLNRSVKTSGTKNMIQLVQSNPFVRILTPLEAQELLKSFKKPTGDATTGTGNEKQRVQHGDTTEQNIPAMTTTLPPILPSSSPPLPPNWNENLQDAIMSLVPYKLFPVPTDTLEYATLAELLYPLEITEAEQIVNPILWSRFVDTRKDMLRLKSDDLQLLSTLGLNDADFIQSAHFSSNFNKDAAVAAYPYNDNMTLLFHCTRSRTNVDNILLQGLDERMGNANGLLGRGIYFSDDPIKSMMYDGCGGVLFIFAVLLGDCLSFSDHLSFKNGFVREPEKVPTQKRNVHDSNFDSIVARPGVNRHSEYVVYNRYQCCPLYKIQYNQSYDGENNYGNEVYSEHKAKLPSFSWVHASHSGVPMPNPLANTGSPFHARSIFAKMGVREKKAEETVLRENTIPEEIIAAEIPALIEAKIRNISSMGFDDANKILETLRKYDYDVDRSVNFLLDQVNDQAMDDLSKHQPSNDTNDSKSSLKDASMEDIDDLSHSSTTSMSDTSMSDTQFDICLICCNDYETTSAHWSVLKCSHKLCNDCYKHIETTRTTMQGVSHTFIKCPYCQGSSGVEVGTCPNGTMYSVVVTTSCEGFEQYNTICITYEVAHSNCMFRRNVYLPDNDEGNEVLQLLRIAWDRRLCFALGTSITNDAQNTLVWNIQHKTSQRGGSEYYGFPDPTYFQRLKQELKAYGIE